MKHPKRTFVKWICLFAVILLTACAVKAADNFWTEPIEREPEADGTFPCRAYYLLNIDGMKGLGHSALLLQDAQGNGRIFSYNGMQYNLAQCLSGKAGVGKMKQIVLSEDELLHFWKTGDLPVQDLEECDNFDRALYCGITEEQYEQIIAGICRYIDTGDEFERLYAQNGEEPESFLARDDIPKYQIYTHNCDTVARELLALVNDEMAEYNKENAFGISFGKISPLTPGGNYAKMCHKFGGDWGILTLGKDSVPERLLSDY